MKHNFLFENKTFSYEAKFFYETKISFKSNCLSENKTFFLKAKLSV